jgi:hypothetical protein
MAKTQSASGKSQSGETTDQSTFSQADLEQLSNLDHHIIAEKILEMMRRDLIMDRERHSQRR